MATKKSTYTPMPEVPAPMRERYLVAMEVLTGTVSMTEASRRLGLSRERMHSLMNRALSAFVTALSAHSPGRPAIPETERQLREESERLRKENERLQGQVDRTNRLLGVASEMLMGRTRPPRGGRRVRAARTTTAKKEPEDETEPRLDEALVMRSCGVSAPVCAAIAGVSPATLRRWSDRRRTGRPLRSGLGRGRRPPVSDEAARCVRELVRDTHGQVGADALRHAVPAVSRRQAAALKRATLTAAERARTARADRIVVHHSGLVRGFDAMYVATTAGVRFLLVAADAAVPFRTSIGVVQRYDATSVAAALDRDFATWGAPLVLRMDRAACQRDPEVAAMLARWGVVVLHGAPHCPRFYGQLERQNREHRAWLDALETPSPDTLAAAVERMRRALNSAWPRRTLGFRTAEQAWNERKLDLVDRDELREEVHDWTMRLLADEDEKPLPRVDAERIAIEFALERSGYLSREAGGWC
jgi:hypothetical protein